MQNVFCNIGYQCRGGYYPPAKNVMQYIKSCGAVVFTRQENELLFLIIRQNNGDCGFPKGRMEPGETERETALREIREEVGLNVRILDGFRQEACYPFPKSPNVMKQSVYFLAEYTDQEIRCQLLEVKTAYLLPYGQAMEILSFDETKQILSEAYRFLTE